MKKLLFCIILIIPLVAEGKWGPVGHRVVGEIAEAHLTKKARKKIAKVLDGESLAMASTWMDFIKSESKYRHMNPWRYATIPDGQTYEEAGTPSEGDVISVIERLIQELKTGVFRDEDEKFALKCLIHLVGDIHQPLHVGNGQDRGGNDKLVYFFGKRVNLHQVWDSGIIDGQKLSYTEYAASLLDEFESQAESWQDTGALGWAYESVDYRSSVYDIPENNRLSYGYVYKNLQIVNQRLFQAGVRLAAVLNAIYG